MSAGSVAPGISAAAPAEGRNPSEVMAAVDLGSNSFHMVVARLQHGQLTIVDRLRDMVRIASGLDAHGRLRSDARVRALESLHRFGERLRDMHAHQVRVVGTNTLRRARDAKPFLAAAEQALGHPVEIISGIEEARLIYVGVSHHVPDADGPMLVIDIGGGSTELIIGRGYEPRYLESLYIGCVDLSRRFFARGRFSAKRFDKARLAVRLELRPVIAGFRSLGWETAVGSSGTIRAAERVARSLGLSDGGLSVDALETLIEAVIQAGGIGHLHLPDFNTEREPVFPGGLAILVETMAGLGIERLNVSDGALREGLLYDMLGRIQRQDARDRTIRAMQRRYSVDEAQARRVETTALALLEQTAESWALNEASPRRLLVWAAGLHEAGLDIAHTKYHEHGAYLIAHADLPGFGRLEQRLLSILVGCHRRKIERFDTDDLPHGVRTPLFRLMILFRLAVLLNRSRSPVELPAIRLRIAPRGLEIGFPVRWLAGNHLTRADLKQEKAWLKAVGFRLRVKALPD